MELGQDYDIKYSVIYKKKIHSSMSIGTVVPSSYAQTFINANRLNSQDQMIFTKSPNNLGVYIEEDEYKSK